MTTPSEAPYDGLGPTAGPAALGRLVAMPVEDFASRYWGRRAALTRAAELPDPYVDLLDEEAVDELVSRRGLRTPFLRVAKNGTTLAERTFTAPGGVGATIGDQVSDDKLVRLFADGSTLVLQALHRVWPPILQFCQRLAGELSHPVQANAYVTPPQNQGFSAHYDVHDVFVLQIAGEKEWTIHEPVHPAPLRDQPWTDRRAAVEGRAAEPPLLREVLRPGDCLYLPRGFLHAARALGGASTHLTIGVHTWTGYALAERLLQEALSRVAQDESVRQSLPLGTSFSDQAALDHELDHVRSVLLDALAAVDAAALAPGLLDQVRGGQRAAPVGPLRQLHSADRLAPDDTVWLRAHLEASVDARPGGTPLLRSRAGDFALTGAELPAAEALVEQGSMNADKLGIGLARRLILAGLVVTE